jgi:hypothetical protein
MFEILDRVIAIRTKTLKELPTRLEKDDLKIYAQLDTRYLVRMGCGQQMYTGIHRVVDI